jgi:aspartate-semialdehyde dehydrogenase
MLKVGFVGWRGMVGSVLMSRMVEENDFTKIEPVFFSTSQVGKAAPYFRGMEKHPHNNLFDAYDIDELMKLDCIVTTHGSEYTAEVLPLLRDEGYLGYWIDASSLLRTQDDAVLVLDPINGAYIANALMQGIKTFVGANCTVSLMLLALDGLFKNNLVEWVSSMTYQAASGAGANNMRELLSQCGVMYNSVSELVNTPNSDILELDKLVSHALKSENLPKRYFNAPLAGNVLPWIDVLMDCGQTKEEWKGGVEANKILGLEPDAIKVDGLCVRVGSMRCHSQGLTIKLRDDSLTIPEITSLLSVANPWVKYIPNTKEATIKQLTPVSVAGSLDIAVGRIRKLSFGEEYLTLFTVGDQLLWGAAEPLRRMLNILVEHVS